MCDWEALFSASLSPDNTTRRKAYTIIEGLKESNPLNMIVSLLPVIQQCRNMHHVYLAMSLVLKVMTECDAVTATGLSDFLVQFLRLSAGVLGRSVDDVRRIRYIVEEVATEFALKTGAETVVSHMSEFPIEFAMPVIAAIMSKNTVRIHDGLVSVLMSADTPNEDVFGAKISILVHLLFRFPTDQLHRIFESLLAPSDAEHVHVQMRIFQRHAKIMEPFLEAHLASLIVLIKWALQFPVCVSAALRLLTKICCLPSWRADDSMIFGAVRVIMEFMNVYSCEDDNTYKMARFCMNQLCEKCDGRCIFSAVCASDFNRVAVLSAFCEFSEKVYTVLAFSGKYQEVGIALRRASSAECPIVSALSLDCLMNMCDCMTTAFVGENIDLIHDILEQYVKHIQDKEIALHFVAALRSLLRWLPVDDFTERTVELVRVAIPFFADLGLCTITAKCITVGMKTLLNMISGFREFVVSTIARLLENGSDECIWSSLILIQSLIKYCCVDAKPFLLHVWKVTFVARHRAKTGEEVDICDSATCTLTRYLGSSSWNDMFHVIPGLLEGARQDLVTSVFDSAAGVTTVAGFVRVISPCDSRCVFANESSMASICSFLVILLENICVFGADYNARFGQQTLEVIANWISAPLLLISIKQLCWSILVELSKSVDILELSVDLFTRYTHVGCVTYIDMTERLVTGILAQRDFAVDDERLSILSQSFLAHIKSKCDTRNIADGDDDILVPESHFFALLLTKSERGARIIARIMPVFVDMLVCDSKAANSLAVTIIALYFRASGDLTLFPAYATCALHALQNVDDHFNLSMRAIRSLDFVVKNIPCDDVFLGVLRSALADILLQKANFENDTLLFYDLALVTFTRVTQTRPDPKSLDVIMSALPMSAAGTDSDFVLSFVVDAIIASGARGHASPILSLLSYHLDTKFVSATTNEKIRSLIAQAH